MCCQPSVGENKDNAVDLTNTETQNHISVIQASLSAAMANLDAGDQVSFCCDTVLQDLISYSELQLVSNTFLHFVCVKW